MLQKVSQVAELLATSISRRSFLSRVGKGALALAGALGILALPDDAEAAGGGLRCCVKFSYPVDVRCVRRNASCPPGYQSDGIVRRCSDCTSGWG